MASLTRMTKPTGCWKQTGVRLAVADVGGQKFCIKCILQIIFHAGNCSPLRVVFVEFVSWGRGWTYRVISQPSDTKILHLCSHRNNLIILKVSSSWAAAAGPFDRYVPPLGVYWKWRLFSSCGGFVCRGKDIVELGVSLSSFSSGLWNIAPFSRCFFMTWMFFFSWWETFYEF